MLNGSAGVARASDWESKILPKDLQVGVHWHSTYGAATFTHEGRYPITLLGGRGSLHAQCIGMLIALASAKLLLAIGMSTYRRRPI